MSKIVGNKKAEFSTNCGFFIEKMIKSDKR